MPSWLGLNLPNIRMPVYDAYSPYYFEGDPDSEFKLEPFLFPIPMPPLRIILPGEDKFPSREKWNWPIGSQKFGKHGNKLETCTAECIVFQGITRSPMQCAHVPGLYKLRSRQRGEKEDDKRRGEIGGLRIAFGSIWWFQNLFMRIVCWVSRTGWPIQ